MIWTEKCAKNETGKMRVRRRDTRIWFFSLGVFAAVFLFTFLVQNFKRVDERVEAASLANFDPGYIISDYTMGNYNSMSEVEIQAFLTAKGNCRDTRTYLADYYSNYSYHIKDGHFVCLAEETFGNGVAYGEDAPDGESAAHIIWQAAQDYRINPQVLIVLLQKEQGLITDSWPNNRQFKVATGYGCPDTAPCAEQYFGFKNQIRKAAALFRTVLDGGWTNYPLGENYVQYNPDPDCGGSVVNIRSLATSALYRYTPYQPNAGALAAGYGTAYCGAYGNRNFYLYFEDWFGGATTNLVWQNMVFPRYMVVVVETMQINPYTRLAYDNVTKIGDTYNFVSKIDINWNGKDEVCLRTEEDTINKIDRCIIMSRMSEFVALNYTIEKIEPVDLDVLEDTHKYDLKRNTIVQEINKTEHPKINFSAKVIVEGVEYYQTSYDVAHGNEFFIPAVSLSNRLSFDKFLYPRNMMTVKDVNFVDLANGESCRSVSAGYTKKFITKISFKNEVYYRTEDDTNDNSSCAIMAKYVQDVDNWGNNGDIVFVPFLRPRELKLKKTTYYTDLRNGTSCDNMANEKSILKFTTKIDLNGKTYFRSEYDSSEGSYCAIISSALAEL